MTKPLNSMEKELIGSWIVQGDSLVADDVTCRIEALIKDSLKEVGASDDGWDILYIDLSDGRYWELTHPNNDLHGGGAPKLSLLGEEQAKAKYKYNP